MLIEPPVPVLELSFDNCLLHCCSLDGYGGYQKEFFARLQQVEDYFAAASATSRYRLWYNLDETELDTAAMERVAAGLALLGGRIYKVAFIGLGGLRRWRFERILRRVVEGPLPRSYFRDAQVAKEWLK